MNNRDNVLDLVRGLSAVLVMLGHLRGFIFLDYGELGGEHHHLTTKLFYFVTGLGHQAVMVFFVLSGYFVGGSVLSAFNNGRFTWTGYGLARLSRLWVVLLPALVLTYGMDQLGGVWNSSAYSGALHVRFFSGPSLSGPVDHSLFTGLGNMAFLQTVAVPVYGSNGPLWSLSNEFWYYLLFPLLSLGLVRLYQEKGRSRILGGCFLAIAGTIILFLPSGIVNAGGIWLMGVGVWKIARIRQVEKLCQNWSWRVVLGAVFLMTLVASKKDSLLGSDYSVGIAFALWMPSLIGNNNETWWSGISSRLSEISYTLYVVHFPILFLVAAVILHGEQYVPGLQGVSIFMLMALGIIIVTVIMWWAFERNTMRVKLWAKELLTK